MLFRRPLKQEELRQFYPSIYAESASEELSDKYLYIPTFKLVEGLEKNGFKIVGAKQQRPRTNSREHVKHVVYMSHESMNSSALALHEEMPMIALTNSHNGLSSFAIDTAFFRLVCKNGLLMPTQSMNSARIVHKKGMEHDVIEASYKIIKAFPEQVAQISAMKAITLDQEEKKVLAGASSRLAFEPEVLELNNKLGNSIEAKVLRPRRYDDQKNDLWTTFNVIQENIIKGGMRVVRENEQGRRSVARTRSITAIDRDTKLNKELMTLAQEMMRIKTGVAI